MRMMHVSDLTLKQKIGQMVMCGFDAVEANSNIESLIRDYDLGGVIYFRRNMQTPAQVAALSNQLQQMVSESTDIPLLISIDQEGGMVTRIEQGVSLMPGNMSLGASNDIEAAYQTAYISGRELRAMGINVNFAPDVDVNNNPLNPVIGVRSYGEDPNLVADMGLAAVRGYESAGVAATIKHFPGHGDTATDSHYALPIVPHNLERLRSIELVPFQKAIEHGVDMVMSAHVIFPALEQGELPSTLSPKVINGFLREELGYQGVVVTDCIEMKAISDNYGFAEGTVLAVEAGVDIVLISHVYEHQIRGINALFEAVHSGRISEERINESVERILKLKQKLQNQNVQSAITLDQVGQPEWQELASSIYEKSITLVKNESQVPLDPLERTLVIWAEVRANTQVVEAIEQEETLGYYLKEQLFDADEVRVDLFPNAQTVSDLLELSKAYAQIVFVTYDATFSEGQVQIAKELSARCKRFVVVAGRNPFDLMKFPGVKGFIAAYENRPLAMRAVAKVLSGEIRAQGKLPVSITEDYPVGWSV
jgi:beta-N-acetylhexosaminidase